LIFKKRKREKATTAAPRTKAALPLPDEKNAIPAVAAVSPPMNSVNALPCAFVAAIDASMI
jgi:hypothetical protein